MISGTPVLNTSDDGRITPTDFFVPSASITVCDTHLPSKKTLDFFMTETLSNWLLILFFLRVQFRGRHAGAGRHPVAFMFFC
jgi:hypothetical protein